MVLESRVPRQMVAPGPASGPSEALSFLHRETRSWSWSFLQILLPSLCCALIEPLGHRGVSLSVFLQGPTGRGQARQGQSHLPAREAAG